MPSGAAELVVTLGRSIADRRVLAAIAALPRERFTTTDLRGRAYENVALPIGCDQTISQPLVVARMLELLELTGSERVLDVGTGSGYHAALLARLAGRVYSIERHAQLSERAAVALAELAIDNVELFVGDGSRGLPRQAPFDAINVAAAVAEPIPAALIDQLAPGGRLVAPVRTEPSHPERQRLALLRRRPRGVSRVLLEPVSFVPLVTEPG